MNVYLAYLLDEYEAAGKKAEEYRREVLRADSNGSFLYAKRIARFESAQRVRRAAFYDSIKNFLDLSYGLDPDDVEAAEKALADF